MEEVKCINEIVKILLDRLILILSAIIFLVAIVGAWFLFKDYLYLSNEWTMFIFNCLAYIVITLYIAFTMTFKDTKKQQVLLSISSLSIRSKHT